MTIQYYIGIYMSIGTKLLDYVRVEIRPKPFTIPFPNSASPNRQAMRESIIQSDELNLNPAPVALNFSMNSLCFAWNSRRIVSVYFQSV
jgi:hypothetical protein